MMSLRFALVLVAGCATTVVGGGAGGGDGTGGDSAGAGDTGASTATAATTSTGDGGAGPRLGVCQEGGTITAGSYGPSCTHETSCEGGELAITCTWDGTIHTCECTVDGVARATCEDDGMCIDPESCCYVLLGGTWG